MRQGIVLVSMLGALAVLTAGAPASAQGVGERPERYGNTASFFFYDNRGDARDFPTNGVFPGNFAADPLSALIGAAGFLESNPQHSAAPYPSQSYSVDMRGRVFCQQYRVDEAGHLTPRQRYHACLPR
jgi:hypothetical protein